MELREFLLPGPRNKIVPPGISRINNHLARHFRKQYFQALRHWSSDKYLPTIARQLRARIKLFRNIDRGATWYVPAVIGLYNVSQAPQQTRMRTLFEEGFGILGGVAGTQLGVSAGIGLVAVLGLGPMGLLIAVFLCATADGIAGNEFLRWIITRINDSANSEKNYHSVDDLIGNFR
jgi:hypothetical protein